MRTLLDEVAERFGLKAEGLGFPHLGRVRGRLDGQQVVCSMTDRAMRLEALFEPALDLGLDVSTRNITFVPTFGRVLRLDDPAWDQELHATADEPPRAARLFGDDVRGAVLGLNATNMGIAVTDERATVMASRMELSSTLDALPRLARFAALVGEARARVPPATPLIPYTEALRAFGSGPARRLAVEGTPLSAAGELHGASVAVGCTRTGRGAFDMAIDAAALEPAADIGLLVRPESVLDRARTMFGGQDLRTGDPAFDPAFLVQAADPERAVAALDGDVRALLLDLRVRFPHVTLSGARLALRGPVSRVSAADIPMILEATATVVERAARASAATPRGAYR